MSESLVASINDMKGSVVSLLAVTVLTALVVEYTDAAWSFLKTLNEVEQLYAIRVPEVIMLHALVEVSSL